MAFSKPTQTSLLFRLVCGICLVRSASLLVVFFHVRLYTFLFSSPLAGCVLSCSRVPVCLFHRILLCKAVRDSLAPPPPPHTHTHTLRCAREVFDSRSAHSSSRWCVWNTCFFIAFVVPASAYMVSSYLLPAHTHSHTLTHSHSLTLTHTHSLSLSLNTHTHTHTYSTRILNSNGIGVHDSSDLLTSLDPNEHTSTDTRMPDTTPPSENQLALSNANMGGKRRAIEIYGSSPKADREAIPVLYPDSSGDIHMAIQSRAAVRFSLWLLWARSVVCFSMCCCGLFVCCCVIEC
jgi:hypothetical protein